MDKRHFNIKEKNPNWKGGPIDRECKLCRKKFTAYPYQIKNGKGNYCSQSCANKGNFSGKTPWDKGKKRLEISGDKHPKWKGGVTTEDVLQRKRFKQQVQRLVFERDDYTCQLCGNRGIDLQVDHIQSWADYPEIRFNLDNCRTLCMKCHYQITYGKPMPKEIKVWGHNLSINLLSQ